MTKKKAKYIIFVLIIIGRELPFYSFNDARYRNGTRPDNETDDDGTFRIAKTQEFNDRVARTGEILAPRLRFRPTPRLNQKSVTRARPYPKVSFPPFHSITSISLYDVRVNVKDPSLLECAGAHKYCVKRNQTNVKGRVFCSCEPDCFSYGDCCWDAPESGNNRSKTLMPEWRRDCVEIPTAAFKRESFVMTTDCPEDYEDNDYAKYCRQRRAEKDKTFKNRQLLIWVSRNLPVTSLASNVTYANVFCAICNDEPKATPWRLGRVNCTYPNDTYLYSDTWSEIQQTTNHPTLMSMIRYCAIVYQKPESLRAKQIIRECDNELEKTCEEKVDDKRQMHRAERCKYYYAPVKAGFGNSKTKYKNKFCAFCAGVSERELNCDYGGVSRTTHQTAGTDLRTPAMSLFFDFSLSYSDDNHELGTGISCLRKDRASRVPELSVLLGKHKITTNWRNRCLLGSNLYEKECYSGTIEPTPQISRDNCLRIDRVLTIVCLGASLVALLGKFICYLAMKRSVSLASRCVLLLALSVFAYQILFLFGNSGGGNPKLCVAVGISIHYFFLASFFWMNVLAYDIHRTFSSPYEVQKPNAKRRLIGYNFYAWMTPAIVVLIAVCTDYASDWNWLKPNYGRGQYAVCWISNNRALIVFFAAPLTFLLLINWAFFVMASFKIASTAKSTSKVRENNKGKKKDRLRLILFVKLALLMGLTWILGIISSYGSSDYLRYLYITVNGLQGVFIFFAFARVPWKNGFDRIHRFVGSISLERSSFSRSHRSSDDSRTTFTHSAKV